MNDRDNNPTQPIPMESLEWFKEWCKLQFESEKLMREHQLDHLDHKANREWTK